MDEIQLISDFEEKDYDLTNIGAIGMHLSLEQNLIYFYSDITDFYYEVNDIEKILNSNILLLKDEDDMFQFTEEQSLIIKEIFKNEYRGKPA